MKESTLYVCEFCNTSNNYCFCLFGNEEQILLPDYSRVIAWRYFPEIWEGEEE